MTTETVEQDRRTVMETKIADLHAEQTKAVDAAEADANLEEAYRSRLY